MMRTGRTIRRRLRSGFTLIELLIAVTALALIITFIVPAISSDDSVRVRAAATLLASDIEFAQVMSIVHPKEPMVVRFDLANNGYWLAFAESPNQPIVREDTGEAYIVHFGKGRVAVTAGVVYNLTNLSDATLKFDPHGGLTNFGSQPPVVTLMTTAGAGGPAIGLSVSPMTGTITETSGSFGGGGTAPVGDGAR